MISPYFIALEIVNFALLALCLWHASRRGGLAVMRLIAGVVFGVMLEIATIYQLDAYEYGRFGVMIWNVPLTIGIGWSIIIYSAMQFSDATSVPGWARPVLDGLLALNIDLAMDTIAIRLGMWDWGMGFERQFFGVPYANFWAWFWVVFFFSGGVRLFARWLRGGWKLLAPVGAILTGVIGVLATNALIVYVIPDPWYEEAVMLTLGAALGLTLGMRPRLREHAADLPAVVVPMTQHLFFLIAGLVSGVIFQPPVLLAISVAMLLISLALHGRSLAGLIHKAAPPKALTTTE